MIHARKFICWLTVLAAISASSVTFAQDQPTTKDTPIVAPDATLVVDSAGHTFIAGSKVGEVEMTNYFRQLAESTTDPRVRIECDQGNPMKTVKTIVEILEDVGVTNLAFVSTGKSRPKQPEPAPKAPLPTVKLDIPPDSKVLAGDILGASAILARGNMVQVTYPSAGKMPVTLYDLEPLRGWDVLIIRLSADGYIFNSDKLVTAKVLQEKLEMFSKTATLASSTPSILLAADNQVPASRLYEAFDILLETGVHVHPVHVYETSHTKRKRTVINGDNKARMTDPPPP